MTYKASGNRDTATLKRAAIQHRDAPFDIEQFISALNKDPAIVDAWQLWSEDKRWSPAWYFSTVSAGSWVVGFYHEDADKQIETEFDDPFRACATFILRELEDYLMILDSKPES